MGDLSPKKNYWQDLLSGVASDLDQMLDDLCLEEIPQQHCPVSRVPSLLEQHVQGLGSYGPGEVGQNGSARKEEWDSDVSSEYKRSAHLNSSPSRAQKSVSSDQSSYEPASDQKSSCVSPSNESSTLSTESIYVPEISALERLICTHPIWFLPDIQRTGTVHLLQGKDVGNFIIRKSSQPNTMALSVRLPEVPGPYIEHYLIEKTDVGNLRLEGSDIHFPSVPLLVVHYSRCCDELPVQLCLPATLALANSRQELLSLALLGQDFWVSSWFTSGQGDRSKDERPTSAQETGSCGKAKLPTPDSPPVSSFGSHVSPSLRYSPPPLPTAPKPGVLQVSSNTTERFADDANGCSLAHTHSPPFSDSGSQKSLVNGSAETNIPSPNIKMTDPYHHTGIVDSPGLYYHSSLADKISDYEDIWGCGQSTTEKKKFVTFKPRSQLAAVQEHKSPDRKSSGKKSPEMNSVCGSNMYIRGQAQPKEMVSHYTQTDDSNKKTDSTSKSFELSRQCSRSVQDVRSQDTSKVRFSSPFYSEPIDAVSSPAFLFDDNSKELVSSRLVNHRHSDPNIPWISQRFLKKNSMKLKHAKDNEKGSQSKLACTSRPPLPGDSTKCKSGPEEMTRESPWPVDSSWEWMTKEKGGFSKNSHQFSLDLKFPVDRRRTDPDDAVLSDTTTVEDLIVLQSPDLRLYDSSSSSSVAGASEYDNLDGKEQQPWRHSDASDVVDDTATEFSEPWDSLRWERLLHVAARNAHTSRQQLQERLQEAEPSSSRTRRKRQQRESESEPLIILDGGDSSAVSSSDASAAEEEEDGGEADDEIDRMDKSRDKESPVRSVNFERKLDSFVGVSRVLSLRNQDSGVGETLRQYIYRLADEKNNTFAMAIENFIQCTKESTETSPHVIMRNIRQFMTGMKNYLLKHGEGQFDELVQQERAKLRSTEFLNIDAIIEGTLHKLVIKPLKNDIYQLFVNEYTKNDSLKSMCDNIKYAQNKTTVEMGIRPEFKPPDGPALQIVKHFLLKLQQEYSPLKKLENLLAAISTIYNCVQQKGMSQEHCPSSLGADDFLPIFIYVLVRCGMISAEIEADFMWGLLHPSLLSGEGGYYLTTLSSAVHVLKNFQASSNSPNATQIAGNVVSLANAQGDEDSIQRNQQQRPDSPANGLSTDSSVLQETRLPSIADLQGFMKIMIPDEMSSSIISKTLPVRPNMTTKDVCKMIAHKFKITNPQDFCLFKLVNGEETQLGDNECPQSLKAELLACGTECLFAYKRCDAKFIWPVMDN